MEEPQYLDITATAELLGVCDETVRRMIARGKLPGAFRVGRLWRVNKSRLMAELQEPVAASEQAGGAS